MGRFLNHSNGRFQTRLNSEIYVDKSGLIKYTNRVINTEQAFICNSRPRRFGKTIAADMLAAYYGKDCDSKEMFESLEIGSSPDFEKHLNKYDVIHFDVQGCMEPSGGSKNVVSYISKNVVSELKKAYPDIVPDSTESITEAMSLINASTGNKFVVIIDEWDVLIRDDADNHETQREYIDFLRSMFKGTEATGNIALAYLTGILPIKKEKTQSALNNFREFTMLWPGPMSEYMGFTEDEVKTLCGRYECDFNEVKRWYDGYRLSGQHVYNPKAVVEVMLTGEFRSYWSQTSTYEVVVPLINMNFDGLRTSIIEMLSGSSVPVMTGSFRNDTISFESSDDVITYLIHLGYLAYDQEEQTAFIPNEEIRQEFIYATRKPAWNELSEFERHSDELLNASIGMDADKVAAGIEIIHTEYASAIRYNDENSLSSVLTIAFLSTLRYYFRPVRELPAGRGFADFVYIPKPRYAYDYPALVVELKWNKDARTALQQIKERNYPEPLTQYTGDIILVGINYDKRTKKHECVMEKYVKD